MSDGLNADEAGAPPQVPERNVGEGGYVSSSISPLSAERRFILQQRSHFSGPLPPPEILAAYEAILAGSAERILVSFEKQTEHRIDLESKVVTSNVFSQRLGAIVAGVIAIMAVGGGIWLTYLGKGLEGLAILLGTLVALVGVFFTGKYMQGEERKKKLEVESSAE